MFGCKSRRAFPVLLILFAIISVSAVIGQDLPEEGTAVFGEWVKNGWYHGKIGSLCGGGVMVKVLFDDGDVKCCSARQIVIDRIPLKNEVKAGASVLAQWGSGRFYPGTVTSISGDSYSISFDDGDASVVTIEQIRLRDAASAAASSGKQSPARKASAQETRTFYVWKSGSRWAEVTPEGEFWINGSKEGEIESNGNVWTGGSRAGEIESDGDIWMNGSQVGEIETNGKLWRSGSRIAEIESDGDIYLDGSHWGEADPFSGTFKEMKTLAALLVFFEPEFGFGE